MKIGVAFSVVRREIYDADDVDHVNTRLLRRDLEQQGYFVTHVHKRPLNDDEVEHHEKCVEEYEREKK